MIYGAIKFVLYADRPDSRTCGELQEFFISPEYYIIVTVPPMIWNGFKSVGTTASTVANCSSLPHSPEELLRRLPSDPGIPYTWDLEHR